MQANYDFNDAYSSVNDYSGMINPQNPSSGSLDYAGWKEGLANMFTGNLDYQRTLQELFLGQQYNAYMASTAHQREARDYAAAGFNPALALGSGGASASSPGVSSFKSNNSGFGVVANILAAVGKMVSNVASDVAKDKRQINYLNQLADINEKKIALGESRLDLLDKLGSQKNDAYSKMVDSRDRYNLARIKIASELNRIRKDEAYARTEYNLDKNYIYNKDVEYRFAKKFGVDVKDVHDIANELLYREYRKRGSHVLR